MRGVAGMMVVVVDVKRCEAHRITLLKTHSAVFGKRARESLMLKSPFGYMEQIDSANVIKDFGKRVQRCYGCFIAYHLKDMYLGEDVTFFCEHCKDDSMFHFDDFSKLLDLSKLKEVAEDDHHH